MNMNTRARESTISDPDSLCEARFECPICLAWLQDPILTSCGHRFCKKCIQLWLKKDKACPIDNIKLEPTIDLFPDNYTKREISQQVTICPNSNLGCTAKISPVDLDHHIEICAFKNVPQNIQLSCLFHDVGCQMSFDTTTELDNHNINNMNHHLALLYSVYSELKSKSFNGSTSLDKSQETFFWNPEKQTGSDSSKKLITLYEKIVLIEQKNHEQDILINNLSQKVSQQSSNLMELTSRYCNGFYLWTVPDFKSKLEIMISHKEMYYSPGFFTSAFGYRLCLRLNLSPNDPNYLALIVHVMKSDHDFTLDWPLNGQIILTLIHPDYPMKNIKEIMFTDPKLEAFKRPVQVLNPRGFGYTEFASIHDVISQGFLKDDQLFVRIQVRVI